MWGKIVLTSAVAAASIATSAPAQALPGNCVQQRWGFLGSQLRLICDDPIQADGSWMRHRVIGIPAHYRNASSSCWGSGYSSNCTFYEAGWVEEYDSDDEWYSVTAATVLPDEPGHINP